MKKIINVSSILVIFALTLTYFVSCSNVNTDNGDETFGVTLEGSTNGYYLSAFPKNDFFTTGYLSSNCKILENKTGAAASFRIFGSYLTITLFEGQSLSTLLWENKLYVYNGDADNQYIGYVNVKKIDGKHKLVYTADP